MVAKLIVKDCPTIEKINLGSSLEEVRANLATIDFKEPAIHILKLQPGVGKTYSIKRFLKNEKSFLIATGSHKLLHGEYDKIGAKHWYGISNKNCSKFKQIKKLKDYNIPIKRICKLMDCDRGKCDYWKQFNTKKAIAPVNYLPTDRVLYSKQERGFKFDLLVFDEALKDYNILMFDHEQMKHSISKIQKYHPVEDKRGNVIEPLDLLMDQFDEYIETQEIPPLDFAHHINMLKNLALNKAIGEKEWDDASAIAIFDIYGYRKFIYYFNIYKKMVYPEPYFYYAMDLALQEVPVVFLDATFDEKAFKVLLGRYIYENSVINRSMLVNRELGSINDLKIKIYYSSIVDKNIKIFRMHKNNFYYRSAFFKEGSREALNEKGKETVKQLRKFIINSKGKFKSVGIITYEPLVRKLNDLGRTEYFGNLRGSNIIKDVDALFIIGTPLNNPIDIIDDYNNLCLTNYDPKDVKRLQYKQKDGKFYLNGWLGPFDQKKPSVLVYDIEDLMPVTSSLAGALKFMKSKGIVDANVFYPHWEFDSHLSESEKYQAVHRARPFENKVQIYMFGDVPEEAKKEFTVQYFNNEETIAHFSLSGTYPIQLYKLISDTYMENPRSASEIARDLKLYKNENYKGGYNTRIVTGVIKGIISMKQAVRIHNVFLNSDLNDEKEIIRRLKKLKIPEECIRYFIFYAKRWRYIRLKT